MINRFVCSKITHTTKGVVALFKVNKIFVYKCRFDLYI